jgi:mannitol-1-/sugar-/sorbitol-6-/2-deoxyglucose-6-phosphatase
LTSRYSPRGLIFDMDGLLVDSEPLWFEVEREIARARGGEWTEELAIAGKGQGVRATLLRMGRMFGFVVDEERDKAEIIDRFIARAHEIRPKPGASGLLQAAKGCIPMALASSSPHRLVVATLNAVSMMDYFDMVISGESVERAKPAPDIFLQAARGLGVPPAQCVVLEDSLAGATAGRAAGMTVIAVPEGPWKGRGFEEQADAIVAHLTEAQQMIDFPER